MGIDWRLGGSQCNLWRFLAPSSFSAKFARALCAALLLLLSVAPVHAVEERYDYDSLGRLIRVIDEQGRTTEYVYDAAGNILQVVNTGAGGGQQPVISTVSASEIRRNRKKVVQITGTGLSGVRVTTSHPDLRISNLLVGSTSASFTLSAFGTVPLGPHTITLTNPTGTANAAVTVIRAIAYGVSPDPLTVQPGSVTRQYTLTASEVDSETTNFTASVFGTIATVPATPLVLTAGQTQVTGSVTGILSGTTVLTLGSPSFVDPIEFNVFVTTDPASVNTNVFHSKVWGLVKGDPTTPSTNTVAGPVVSAPLGVVKGDPTAPSADAPGGPVVSPTVGVNKL